MWVDVNVGRWYGVGQRDEGQYASLKVGSLSSITSSISAGFSQCQLCVVMCCAHGHLVAYLCASPILHPSPAVVDEWTWTAQHCTTYANSSFTSRSIPHTAAHKHTQLSALYSISACVCVL